MTDKKSEETGNVLGLTSCVVFRCRPLSVSPACEEGLPCVPVADDDRVPCHHHAVTAVATCDQLVPSPRMRAASGEMGERKDAIPVRRRRQLQLRAALLFAALVGAAVYSSSSSSSSSSAVTQTNTGGAHGASLVETARGVGHARMGDGSDEGSRVVASDHAGYDDRSNDPSYDQDDRDTGAGDRGVDRVGTVRERPSMTTPEFAFGGRWAPSKASATVVDAHEPSFACHASTLLHLRGGWVMMAWFGGSYEGAEDVAIWTAKRSPSGVWTTPAQAAKVHRDAPYNGKNLKHNGPYNKPEPARRGGEPHWNPVLWCADAGTDENDGGDGAYRGECAGDIILYFKIGWKIPFWETYSTRSRDGGETWSTPSELVRGDKGGRGPVKNKPIVLSDGVWAAPASLEGPMGNSRKQWRAFIDISKDQGRTWRAGPAVMPLNSGGVIQPTVWESKPGHLHMLLRSSRGRQMWVMRSDSRDGGKTWTPARKTRLPNNNSGLDVAYLPKSGTLVLAYNHVMNTDSRSPMRLAISEDNGENWSVYHDTDVEKGSVKAGHEYSYPSCVPWPEDSAEEGVSVAYTWHRRRMVFFSVSLRELKAMSKPLELDAVM